MLEADNILKSLCLSSGTNIFYRAKLEGFLGLLVCIN